MTVRQWIVVATTLFTTAVLDGCGSGDRNPGDIVEREGNPPVISVADDDPEMLAAIQNARSTAAQFITVLGDPKPSQSGFSVKLPVKDGDHIEHMWVLPVRYENGRFVGTINNEPDQVTTVKLGDEVDVARDQISDWMYVENGELRGGYTIRALWSKMPEGEREEFERALPFKMR